MFANSIQRNAFVIGAAIGLGAAAVMFMNVQWYHDLVVWSWTNPLAWAIGVPVGIAAALIHE